MSIDPVSGVSGATGTATTTTATRTPVQTMGSDVFMSLLVTQLKNQDPSSPMDTGQMISQTTQLSMMEKLTQLAEDTTTARDTQVRAASAALVGKTVSYRGADGATTTGLVDGVTYAGSDTQKGSDPTLSIGGTRVHYADVLGVDA
ncbi:flagellar hook capping FlgD N-terminal domain-containing protein [Tersicoccus sp. MR15.9]|uniref:flagellar hook assembly protein FlgD n=1 Tax=Tersicoccus mangrovi TaxID=3121635 RepID=UPI002FE67370